LKNAKYGNYNTLPMDTMHAGDTMHERMRYLSLIAYNTYHYNVH